MSKRPVTGTESPVEGGFFLAVLVLVSIGAVAVVLPFYGAVMWAAILALLFQPLHRKLSARWRNRETLGALATLLVILLIVILPLALVGLSIVQEVTSAVQKVRGGQIDFGAYFQRILTALPSWATDLLGRSNIDDIGALQRRLTDAITKRGQMLATQAFDVGSNVLDLVVSFFVAMYLLFFLLRDGPAIGKRIRRAIPLEPRSRDVLVERFTTVLLATVKGNVLIAVAQGALGGLAFWVLGIHAPLLWAVVMAFLSLLPAIGAALIWAPVALYLLAVGQVWQGVGLAVFGVVVIGLVDNLLRPVLVGKDTRLPDYVVLISTIGGLALVGINGFVLGPLVVALAFSLWEMLADKRGAIPAADARKLEGEAERGKNVS